MFMFQYSFGNNVNNATGYYKYLAELNISFLQTTGYSVKIPHNIITILFNL
ncbi:hypothetical protein NEIELOOT_01911 [Neisseria elongata subsp. glycolytica ATCC 29315]|uniref:Uncharacterized protein n=1 Tax=Neisseria elongata subsp. glycolytica ATCC 29315 TaxID=546263 RepID=D4DS68_NEIEG|nr:hypothetical protein NEIELOOT_01911 [Neisseria elongata subsp. glycolytica ATCC 29315]